MSVGRADEVRLYDVAVGPGHTVLSNHDIGRFVREGLYRSPLHVPDGPVGIDRLQ